MVDLAAPDSAHAAALDNAVLDAALWRTHRVLARHWLHAMRGSLNALSLKLVLLTGSDPDKGASDAGRTLRGHLRELDAALTSFLDYSWLDEAPAGRAGIDAVTSSVSSLVEPLARRRQTSLDVTGPEPAWLAVDPGVAHAMVLVLATEAIDSVEPRRAVQLAVHVAEGRARLSFTWPMADAGDESPERAATPARPEARPPGSAQPVSPGSRPGTAQGFDAVRRVARRLGGDAARHVASGTAVVTLQLPLVAPVQDH
jgi:hypothetical protein